VRVLYVNHTAEVSGGEHSLLGLLEALPDSVEPRLAAPRGRLTDEAHGLGISTVAIPGTAGSLRLHPLHTPRTLVELAAAAAAVRVSSRRYEATVLHANSIRAGLVIGLSHAQNPKVVHVRDCLPPSPLGKATLRMIASTATTVVANSEYTAQSVRRAAPNARLEVVHNPVDLARWDPGRIDRAQARVRLPGATGSSLLLGVVAQLTPWKGQDTAIEALSLLVKQGIDAHLFLIGSAKFVSSSTRHDNRAYVERLKRRVSDLGLEDRISWLGERDDVVELVAALDVLLLPSREEPFGRAVIEAMAMEVPVVATNAGGPPEIFTSGTEGYLVAPLDPQAWADAITRIAGDPTLGRDMGKAGRRRAKEAFSVERHISAILGVYERALAGSAR
jgi:glycosyltransferase involved in cell wall biosynthesis